MKAARVAGCRTSVRHTTSALSARPLPRQARLPSMRPPAKGTQPCDRKATESAPRGTRSLDLAPPRASDQLQNVATEEGYPDTRGQSQVYFYKYQVSGHTCTRTHTHTRDFPYKHILTSTHTHTHIRTQTNK